MKKNIDASFSVIMLGATGAVGTESLNTLLTIPQVNKISLLGRRPVENIREKHVHQYNIDVSNPSTYSEKIAGHQIAICTLGVGQPSKVSREDFLKIDKIAVLDFAKACKANGVQHFELLSSVGINSKSSSFFLRAKGELVEELKALQFDRLSIFQPSMILTPNNRYGMMQGLTLAIWPIIDSIFFGSLKKYKGVKVENLGKAIALNILEKKSGEEMLTWEDFNLLIN